MSYLTRRLFIILELFQILMKRMERIEFFNTHV